MHYRATLRNEARALLSADAEIGAMTRVVDAVRVSEDDLPAYSVKTPGEDRTNDGQQTIEAVTDLMVAITVSASRETLEDTLDNLSGRVETAILGGLRAATGAQNIRLTRTETKTGPEGAKMMGSLLMLFIVRQYFVLTPGDTP